MQGVKINIQLPATQIVINQKKKRNYNKQFKNSNDLFTIN